MPWHQGVLLIPSIDLRAREQLVFRAAEQSFGGTLRGNRRGRRGGWIDKEN